MGEIGLPRHEVLNELRMWEVNAIIKGYSRRHKELWSAVRWSTFSLMCAFAGGENMKKEGIFKPSDLIRFPWDKERLERPLSEEDEQGLIEDMRSFMKNGGF